MRAEPREALRSDPPHDSAHLHVSGRALYTDDVALPADTLHGAFGLSRIAHGRVRHLDLSAVERMPGVVTVATAADVPGENNYGSAVHDDPIFAPALVQYAGQSLFAVAADSYSTARRAARRAHIEYEPLPAILDIRAALAAGTMVVPTQRLVRGAPHEILTRAPHRLTGTVHMGGQDHFYLEGQIAVAIPQENAGMLILSSTQHPSEVQQIVAHALGWHVNQVTVQCRRMGGGFGGKETQPALIAAAAAVLALKSARPVKLRLDRDTDMLMTGKRHDFLIDYCVGFEGDGRILALTALIASRCGYSADLSGPVNDRAVLHLDNAYYLEHVEIVSHRCKTHTVSNTAFRGFGGPQAMLAIETIVDSIARTLGLDPLAVRRRNFYGIETRNVTHYGQPVEQNVLHPIVDRLAEDSGYHERRQRIAAWNAASPLIKRGLALTPVKFGISFTTTLFNQAGALLQVYTDGTVLVNHGGTEMGQGLFIKVGQVVARELGLPLTAIRMTATDTSKVPNTSATAASTGSDLNGKAAQAAAQTIRGRLVEFACATYGVKSGEVRFHDGSVEVGEQRLTFAELVLQAYRARISLSATGFYRTPKIEWDKTKMRGRPFFYYAYGAAVSEVALDTLTGETQLLRVDILHDVGRSLNTAIDMGQVEGGFLQGVGWLTSEELWWNPDGPRLARRDEHPAARECRQRRGHHLSLEGGGRAAFDARDLGVPCHPRRHRQLRGWAQTARPHGTRDPRGGAAGARRGARAGGRASGSPRAQPVIDYLVDWSSLLLRWLHVIAGIAWIGSSFYFVWLDDHLEPPLDPERADAGVGGELWAVHGGGFYRSMKYRVAPARLPPTLHWFYWEAYTTWLSGFALLSVLYLFRAEAYLIDPQVAALTKPVAIAMASGVLVVSWVVYDLLCRSPLGRNTPALGAVIGGLAALLAWGLCQLFSGRGAFILFGAALGTIMVANVLFVIIPGQRELVRAKREGREPDPTPGLKGKQRSVHNTYFTLPVVFTMVSNHYAMTYGGPYNWVNLIALSFAGACIRVWFVARHKPEGRRGLKPLLPAALAAVTLIGLVVALAPPRSAGPGHLPPVVDNTLVSAIVEQRCVPCHATHPAQVGFNAAPNGVVLETLAQLRAHLPEVQKQLAMRTMPLGNLTRMTDEERAALLMWIGHGAH
jgi:xanthine dehydrogenase large subunit